ncbi:unannotated protein [freshwater metagenome]|uniref:Unannotated protein n=1 Tax=freshwater metagenome TaxID=449393 RepID=A0A6J7K322_9ZZZZ
MATLPSLEIIETTALVVDVLPFVPDIQIIFLSLDNSAIAFG